MLTEILDQWEVLVELQRQQNTWQQRWDRAQTEFQRALQQLDQRDADRLARVLAESLPASLQITNPTPASSLVGSLSNNAHPSDCLAPVATPLRPSATPNPAKPAAAPTPAPQPEAAPHGATAPHQSAAPQPPARPNADIAPVAQAAPKTTSRPVQTTATSTTTAAQPPAVSTGQSVQSSTQASTPNSTPSPVEVHGQTPTPLAAALPEPPAVTAEPMFDEAAIFASDDAFFGSIAEDTSATPPLADEPAQSTASPPAAEPTPAQLDLLQWATETIGDGVTENELFQAMRKSPFAGQARQLFELLRERDAFYETADEVIHVHSLRKIAEFQNT